MGNNLTFTRGDTKILNIHVSDENGSPYAPAPGDKITLTVRKKSDKGELVIQKTTGDADVAITATGWEIIIQPSDTSGLEYSSYVYDIEVVLEDGYVQTIIPISTLTLGKEVTYTEVAP